MCINPIQKYGATPINIQWTVVRGDNASLRVDFLEDDETTVWDTEDWIYKATSYDPQGNVLDNLTVEAGNGYANIMADSCLTDKWGTGYKTIAIELRFDLQIIIPRTDPANTTGQDFVWTPILGTICVLGDVTPGGSL